MPPFVVLATSENADQSQQIWMPDTFFQNEKYVICSYFSLLLDSNKIKKGPKTRSRTKLRHDS